MNLTNRDCFRAVSAGVSDLIGRFDWDGVNLAELYFESLEGLANPSRFTPMNDDVRAHSAPQADSTPSICSETRKDAASQRAFLDFRARLAREMQQRMARARSKTIRRDKPLSGPGAHACRRPLRHLHARRHRRGCRAASAAARSTQLHFPDRRPGHRLEPRAAALCRDRPPLSPAHAAQDRLAIDLNIVERYQNVYPTKQQTGAELFEVVHSAAGAFRASRDLF